MSDDVSAATLAAVTQFNDVFNRHDVDAVMACMTDDCLFESTPPPDGREYRGQAAVRSAWEEFFRNAPDAVFETEEIIPFGDCCLVLWHYRWGEDADTPGHVRGIDLFRVRDGKVAEKRAYVKG